MDVMRVAAVQWRPFMARRCGLSLVVTLACACCVSTCLNGWLAGAVEDAFMAGLFGRCCCAIFTSAENVRGSWMESSLSTLRFSAMFACQEEGGSR